MYSEKAREMRQCKAKTAAGERCKGWAMWGDKLQRCGIHAGHVRRGRREQEQEWLPFLIPGLPRKMRERLLQSLVEMRRAERASHKHAKVEPCRCAAYAWPHRPGSGVCRWPDPPELQVRTPAGTRSRYHEYRHNRDRVRG